VRAHWNDQIHWLSGASWLFRKQLTMLTSRMAMHVGPHLSRLRAIALTNSAVDSQAQVFAYGDVLRYFGFLCLFCMPLAFLLKKPNAGAQGWGVTRSAGRPWRRCRVERVSRGRAVR
jgi:DHA2 family multidrug resistance protein